MPRTQKRSTAAKRVKKPLTRAPATRAKKSSAITPTALPQAQAAPSLPAAVATPLLPAARQWPRWAPYFGGLAILVVAITGALVFGAPSYAPDTSSQGMTLGETDTTLTSPSTSSLSQWGYRYSWTGNEISPTAPEVKVFTEEIPEITSQDFSALATKFGLGEDVRVSTFEDGSLGFEAGVTAPSPEPTIDENTDAPDAAVLNDPEAYQLYGYSQDNRYWYSLLSSANWFTEHTGNPPDEESAQQLAEEYLRSRGLLPADAQGPYVLQADQGAPFTSVYYAQQINGQLVIDASGEIVRYVSVEFAADAKVVSVSGPIVVTNFNESALEGTVKSPAQAWDELQANTWGPGRGMPTSEQAHNVQEISVQSVEPAYLQIWNYSLNGQRIYEPVYRFHGAIDAASDGTSFPYYVVVPLTEQSAYVDSLEPAEVPVDAVAPF